MSFNGRARVLVADSDPHVRFSLSKFLHQAGILSDSCGDGREAIGKLSSAAYAVIVLDLLLPHTGAERIIEIVREQPRDGRPVVLAIAPAAWSRPLDVGVVQIVLRRPCDARQLADMIPNCVRISSRQPGDGVEQLPRLERLLDDRVDVA